MNQKAYRQLIENFCALCGLDAPRLLEDGLLTIGETDLLLIYNEQINPHRLHIRINLGLPAPEIQAAVWGCMLAANYSLALDGLYVFSLQEGTGNVVLTLTQPLAEDFTAQELADNLEQYLRTATSCWENLQNVLRAQAGSEEGTQSIYSSIHSGDVDSQHRHAAFTLLSSLKG